MQLSLLALLYASVLSCVFQPTYARDQNSYINELDSRTSYLEEQVRFLNGKLEELNHTVKLLQQNAAPTTPSGTVVTAPPAGQAKPVPPVAAPTPVTSAPTPIADKPGLPVDAAQADYDKAVAFLNQANYTEAEAAFKGFIASYPKDPRVVNAKYWLGETYMMQTKYGDAAVAFAEAYEIYKQQTKKGSKATPQPTSLKAPESLIKLVFALKGMGSNEDACATLAQLKKEFPQLPHNLQSLAGRAKQGLRCQ